MVVIKVREVGSTRMEGKKPGNVLRDGVRFYFFHFHDDRRLETFQTEKLKKGSITECPVLKLVIAL